MHALTSPDLVGSKRERGRSCMLLVRCCSVQAIVDEHTMYRTGYLGKTHALATLLLCILSRQSGLVHRSYEYSEVSFTFVQLSSDHTLYTTYWMSGHSDLDCQASRGLILIWKASYIILQCSPGHITVLACEFNAPPKNLFIAFFKLLLFTHEVF